MQRLSVKVTGVKPEVLVELHALAASEENKVLIPLLEQQGGCRKIDMDGVIHKKWFDTSFTRGKEGDSNLVYHRPFSISSVKMSTGGKYTILLFIDMTVETKTRNEDPVQRVPSDTILVSRKILLKVMEALNLFPEQEVVVECESVAVTGNISFECSQEEYYAD